MMIIYYYIILYSCEQFNNINMLSWGVEQRTWTKHVMYINTWLFGVAVAYLWGAWGGVDITTQSLYFFGPFHFPHFSLKTVIVTIGVLLMVLGWDCWYWWYNYEIRGLSQGELLPPSSLAPNVQNSFGHNITI